jgi:hypothetical protein
MPKKTSGSGSSSAHLVVFPLMAIEDLFPQRIRCTFMATILRY